MTNTTLADKYYKLDERQQLLAFEYVCTEGITADEAIEWVNGNAENLPDGTLVASSDGEVFDTIETPQGFTAKMQAQLRALSDGEVQS